MSSGSSGSSGSAQLGLPEIHVNPEAEPVPIPVPGQGPWPEPQPAPPPATPAHEPGPTAAPVPAPIVDDLELVGQLTGHGSENRTDKRWQVMGTDLGIVWESRPGEVAVAFGDTIGAGPRSGNPDWRSNALAHSTDRNLADGMRFDSMVSDSRCHAVELLTSRKVSNYEITSIPTSGFALGDRQYLSYMSIARWSREPGRWWTNYGGIAWSDDNGQTWTKSQHAQWHNFFGLGKFQVTAMVPHGDYVYMFGTPNGRFGSIALARVPLDQVLNKSAYQYWIQGEWAPVAETLLTALGENTATPIADGIAGEISVRFDTDTQLWQMSYLDVSRGAIVLRNATSPQGIWSAPTTLIDHSVYPQVYGGFIHPWSTSTDLYVLISEWQNYNVHLMHARITPQP